MNSYSNQLQENKNQKSLNVTQKRNNNNVPAEFSDQHPATVAQMQLQEIANNSEQVKQAVQLQAMANTNSSLPIQKKGVEEEELQMKVIPIQRQNIEEDEALQGRFTLPIQKKENNTGLPDNLKSGIENLSGYSMDDVKVHYNSDKPAQLQAHAYAQGTDIHIASGQEKHLPHEAWHVVQQKQDRVKPTLQMKGNVNVNDDAGLESEADVMGSRALQMRRSASQYVINRTTQFYAVTQLHKINLVDPTLATKIASLIGKSFGEVFNVMLDNKNEDEWKNLEADQEPELIVLINNKLGLKAEASLEHLRETEEANEILQEFYESDLNREVLNFIARVGSEGGKYVTLYRGASPTQALKIMAEQTLGGEMEIEDDEREPPTEQMQRLQTGLKIKQHLDSTGKLSKLEEWSRGVTAKESFSKNGWVLTCIVAKIRTNYDDSLKVSGLGEAGVVGWVETPCLVAIEKKGAELIK
jgi:hypothetical protein